MAIFDILYYPDPVLTQPAALVRPGEDLLTLISDMLETLKTKDGIGLAAPQVGVAKRLFIVDLPQEYDVTGRVFINPEITWRSEELSDLQNGCLSFPGFYADISRPKEIELSYCDEKFTRQKLRADGLFAACLQHEMDHLDGILFIDRISKIRRNILVRKYKKSRAQ